MDRQFVVECPWKWHIACVGLRLVHSYLTMSDDWRPHTSFRSISTSISLHRFLTIINLCAVRKIAWQLNPVIICRNIRSRAIYAGYFVIIIFCPNSQYNFMANPYAYVRPLDQVCYSDNWTMDMFIRSTTQQNTSDLITCWVLHRTNPSVTHIKKVNPTQQNTAIIHTLSGMNTWTVKWTTV